LGSLTPEGEFDWVSDYFRYRIGLPSQAGYPEEQTAKKGELRCNDAWVGDGEYKVYKGRAIVGT
jgi:hypothetical protein